MIATLQYLLISILPFLVILTTIVTVHELGHFWMARFFGVEVDRFSLGFGKAIASRTDKRGVEWRIGWLPIGGYVRFSGDSNDASLPDGEELETLRRQIVERDGPGAERRYYHFKPVWQRALIAVAGPAANFILAIAIFTVVLTAFGELRPLPRVGAVEAGSPAAAAGFQPGDTIKTANGKRLDSFDDLTALVRLHTGDPISFQVERNGKELTLVATPVRSLIVDKATGSSARLGRLGIASNPKDYVRVRYNPISALSESVVKVGDVIGGTMKYLGRVFTGRESGREVGGVIGMAQTTGSLIKAEAAHAHGGIGAAALSIVVQLAWFCALISIGIGFVNLLPIPMLDGGHLMFYAYEAVARRPLAAKIQAASYPVGLALVVGLMLFATWNDLQRQHVFQLLGGLFS
jgi:regulator of sigma E protease